MKTSLALLLATSLSVSVSVSAFAAKTGFPDNLPAALPLWPHGAPGSEARVAEPEKVDGSNVSNVHNPSITPFIPAADKATGLAVIVCPGGGQGNIEAHQPQALGVRAEEHGPQ